MRQLLLRLRRNEEAARPPHAYLGALGGVGLFALALVFILGGVDLGVGSPRRLGTGAFPVLTGGILALLALAVIAADLRDRSDAERPDWISFVAIGAALAVFALTVGRIGLVPGVFLTVITASLPDPSLRFPGKMALAALVGVACWGLFIGVIGLPFDAFRGI
ncbi:tripartite tricarboxylate transporter TctB family protein [Jannaschia sp. M317]|uniref:tripartite tricarboxylate transporter TctB family protein n=1 Tax=Jannaschia sp. M317 TaxID=2867011 RepID=UPI0021A96ACF|nr:tripartite tricarboxylate transporter TctB family protein [Jannaschia sp. M317]UWQ17767.1 tripartite tricarboxylate transporter TctB family protein [Jannaschia sp. M317]